VQKNDETPSSAKTPLSSPEPISDPLGDEAEVQERRDRALERGDSAETHLHHPSHGGYPGPVDHFTNTERDAAAWERMHR
jgi:hypothetical protein